MTVKEAMTKYGKSEYETRIYVKELNDEVYRDIYRYADSEVICIYPHNGDMVCEVEKAK